MLVKDFSRHTDVSALASERTNDSIERREPRRTVPAAPPAQSAGISPRWQPLDHMRAAPVLDREESKTTRVAIGSRDIVAPDRTYHLQIDMSESVVVITETIGESRTSVTARICNTSPLRGCDAVRFSSVLANRERAPGIKGAEQQSHIPQSARNTFRKEGEYWTVIFGGEIFRLKDARGLHYLALLLMHPGERFHATELIRAVERTPLDAEKRHSCVVGQLESQANLGDAGPAIDLQARADYRRRITELQTELLEAGETNDYGRAERIRQELEFLTCELSAAIGLGGRTRSSASHSERARVVVTRNIRATLKKILVENPTLGRHFNLSIKTGNFCAYLPEPEGKIFWQN